MHSLTCPDAALRERYRAALHALRCGERDGDLLLSYVLWPTRPIQDASRAAQHDNTRHR